MGEVCNNIAPVIMQITQQVVLILGWFYFKVVLRSSSSSSSSSTVNPVFEAAPVLEAALWVQANCLSLLQVT